MSYINQIQLPKIGANEVVPLTITFEEVQTINTIVSVKRYNESTGDTTGTDISANASATTNVITLTSCGTIVKGVKYRVQIIVTDSTGATQTVETNLMVTAG